MLLQKIESDLKDAMKSGNRIVVDTLRMTRAELKNREIDLRTKNKELNEDEVIAIVRHEIKKRGESIELFKKGNRDDLAEKEMAELEVLKSYLPRELSDDELKSIVDECIAQNAALKNNFGALMKEAMKVVGNRASGGRVASMIKNKIIC